MDRRKGQLAPVLVSTGLLLAMLAVYVGGYFATSRLSFGPPGMLVRVFNAPWQAFLYAPAAWLESQIRGEDVYNSWESAGN